MQRNGKEGAKKIALFVPSLKGGGAERAILNMANELSKVDALQIDLVLCEKDGPYLAEVREGVTLVELKSPSIPRSLLPLIGYLRAEKPTVLISTLSHASVATIVACRLSGSGTKTIIRMANTFSEVLKNISFFYRNILFYGVKYFFPLADEIVAVSCGVADDLANETGISRNRIKVIYNSVDIVKIEGECKKESTHPWIMKKETPIVLAVGRLTVEKDYSTLIRAFDLVSRKSDARLIILGEGKKREEIEEIVKKMGLQGRVDMPGFVENPFAYMVRCDVFVLSSVTEGMPNTLIEAMACGSPVVSTDCPSGPREILENGKYGKLVEVGNEKNLAKAILETIERPLKAEVIKSRIRNNFALEKTIQGYRELIQKHSDI